MKHASAAALDQLGALLADLRALPGITEKSPGVFYRRGKAFLHFHEDPKGLFGDVRDAAARNFERIDVTSESGRRALLATAKARLGP